MGRLRKELNRMLWLLFFGTGLYIMVVGGQRFLAGNIQGMLEEGKAAVQRVCQREFAHCLYPGLFLEYEEEGSFGTLTEWYIQRVMAMHPLSRLQYAAESSGTVESTVTYEMLASGGIHDESEPDLSDQTDSTEELVQEENEQVLAQASEQAEQMAEERADEETENLIQAGTIYNMEELSDFDFLLSHFYTIETNTTITAGELNAETLLSKDMHIDKDVDGPQILIYHTHSQEGFVDSVPGDNSTTIVGVGEYLAQLLREKGYDVMHVTSVYDLVDGKLDRNEAYSKAYDEISGILEEYPSIQSVIDLHRDGVKEGTRLVTEMNGKTMAKYMFFNGLSRTKKNGSIDYLYNPYIQDNLALTLQLKLVSEQYYPGLARNIYLKSLRYNLHLSDKALLIEAGAQTNTLQEMLNTMEPLSDVLDKVFSS